MWIEVLSGNSSDKKSFRESIKKFREQFDKKKLPYFVADSALYTAEGLKELSGIKWVSRALETIQEPREARGETKVEEMEESGLTGYQYREMEKNQKRLPTKSPTIRWVFQKFEDVMILYVFESDRLKLVQCELTQD